jgi:hypothetical protein
MQAVLSVVELIIFMDFGASAIEKVVSHLISYPCQ